MEIAAVAAAQAQCAKVLLGLCDDPEWVVRYSAIAGLESLGQAAGQIKGRLQQVVEQDVELAVQARARLALQRIEQRIEH
jgi:phycocyanobilin lyase beta subunit